MYDSLLYMKKWLFILLGILYFIGLAWLQVLQQKKGSEDMPSTEVLNEPLPSVEKVLLPIQSFQWQLPDMQLNQKKSDFVFKKNVEKSTFNGLWSHISIGRCGPDQQNPAYLEQRMQRNTGDKRNLPLGNVDCGFIRTKIPFSF